MEDHGMYGERAALYDLIYHWKDYAAEAERVRDVLRAEGVADGARVLETACGTGNYLVPLAQWYQVLGLDLNAGMLAVARNKVPDEVELLCDDMTTFELAEPVEAILCLFSSIGYLEPATGLPAALRAFHRALRPDGIVIVEPWLEPEAVKTGTPWMQTYQSDDLRLARACTTVLDGRRSVLDFHWLVASRDGVEHFSDLHELWCSTQDELLAAFDSAGFDARFESGETTSPRGWVIARRRE